MSWPIFIYSDSAWLITPGIFARQIAISPVRRTSGYSTKNTYNLSLHEVFDLLIQNGEKILFYA